MINGYIRFFDSIISSLLITFLSPLIIFILILIFLFDGRPLIFKQVRIGQHGKKFKIYKFRTMKNNLTKKEKLRLTKLGKVLRRMSLDEIPQLINVLKKEMSLVGPRPLPEENEKKINKKIRLKRRIILPGLTGMSQINYNGKYRNINDKVKLDVQFVENYTLYNYFKIILKTPVVLVIRLLKNKSSIIK